MLLSLHPKYNNDNINHKEMEMLSKQEMEKILGGGWIQIQGRWIYLPDGNEEDEEDDVIFG